MSNVGVLDERQGCSQGCHQALLNLTIEELVRQLIRPNDGDVPHRGSMSGWPSFERPQIDRFKDAEFDARFEGPQVIIDGRRYPIYGYIEYRNEWMRIGPVEAFELRERLREVVDQTLSEWMNSRAFDAVPAHEGERRDGPADGEAAAGPKHYAPGLGEFGEF